MIPLKDATVLALGAIIVIGIVLVVALIKEVNGTLLAVGLAAISGLAGYEIKALREKG